MDDKIGGICIVTQPSGGQGEKTHTRYLTWIVGEITSVVVLTTNLLDDSTLWDQ